MNLQELIDAAIREDIPRGDLTTRSLKTREHPGEAHLLAKEDLILSGSAAFEQVMQTMENSCHVRWNFEDGQTVLKNQVVAVIEGNLIEILQAERVALNFVGHLCGIATLTGCYVKALEGTGCTLLDTRKTLPGYRELAKKAVRDGGGKNHRMNLSESILIKENHLQVAGGIPAAIEKIRQETTKPIELEVKNLEEVKMAIELRVDRVMLDNMSLEEMAEALKVLPASVETEASGNMTLERIRPVAELGVQFISVGALTHSAPSADLSLLFLWEEEDDV